MHPLDYPLLADENVAIEVVERLVARGVRIEGVRSRGLGGRSDNEILALAFAEGKVVLTHDGDFGSMALRAGVDVVGVVYLRPGHIDAREVLRQIDAVRALDIDARPPFVLVADRKGDSVRVRLRRA